MTWHGWVWERGRWRHVCSAATLAEAGRELSRLRPDVPCARHGLTGGGAPDWEPGRGGPRASQVAEASSPVTPEDPDR
jgi:hypothetical protein